MNEDRFWFSGSDSDVAMWMLRVLAGRDFDVMVTCPDVTTVHSPRSKRNPALATPDTRVAKSSPLRVDYPPGGREATMAHIPFVGPEKRLARGSARDRQELLR